MIIKNERKKYASDLTDGQWEVISPLFPPAGNKSKWEKRELVDAVLYLVDNGCKWRNLPHDFPPHTTVSNFYYAAVKSGLWEKLLTALVQYTRKQAGRTAQPSYAIIDSQSVKTTGAAQERGIDGGKKQKDTSGIL
ncbi:MAG: transposase [Oscillospiraceae bacterium]|nr:transposase [Oscillospiraceae bacterium]